MSAPVTLTEKIIKTKPEVLFPDNLDDRFNKFFFDDTAHEAILFDNLPLGVYKILYFNRETEILNLFSEHEKIFFVHPTTQLLKVLLSNTKYEYIRNLGRKRARNTIHTYIHFQLA